MPKRPERTQRFGIRVALALATLAALTAPSPAVEVTRAFRLGLDGYDAVTDTWVSRLDWDNPAQRTVNYGQNTDLSLNRDGGDNPLLRFDLALIPANSAVISASLRLYNTQRSSYDGTADFSRRIRCFQVLRAWDEGNQINAPINAAGRHGATGEFAAHFFPGEGIDVPWTAVGMEAGADYDAIPESYADVVNAGWYAWDVTGLVRRWVRGEAPNFGLVLRDATGYADNHVDWRTFRSSQFTGDPSLRPTLVVVYNPDVPFSDAGPDFVDVHWDGSGISLDGSASHDRPGGGDANTLRYRWEILRAGYGSTRGGVVADGYSPVATFTPDVAGAWEFRLTVTNALGESAADTVAFQLLRIPVGHPRIFLTPDKLAALRSRATPGNPRWAAVQAEADDPGGAMLAKALAYAVTGQAAYGDQAVAAALSDLVDPAVWSTKFGDLALVYDWCYDRLSSAQRSDWVARFNTWAQTQQGSGSGNDLPGWGNYWPRYTYSFALVGLATCGENDRAPDWLHEFRTYRFETVDLPLLDIIADGGAWPEGTVYDGISRRPHCQAVEAWRSATGENLFLATPYFVNRLAWLLMQGRPGLIDNWNNFSHDYPSLGDAERNRVSMTNYLRSMGLLLIERFPDHPDALELQAYYAAPPVDHPMSFLAHEEFLWFDPLQTAAPPSRRTQLARGTGSLICRSGWPSGPADTDTSATHVVFQCGDHFTYHQHYDQNAFTLFKHADLLLDSGVYSGDGLSYHDQNYYVRTIAHNTLIVHNPAERFDDARPDAESNDGGQRTMLPASRYPQSAEYFQTHMVHYDTGDILRFQDDGRYTYALGDAGKAYNSPAYCQATDTPYTTNTPKVSQFQREFLYLRSPAGAPAGQDYLILFDRVAVTQPAFSGGNTKLLFHVLNEPTVSGSGQVLSPGETLYEGASDATTVNGEGKVFFQFLAPEGRNLRKVGGRGQKAFWVFGANYDWQWDPGEPQPRPVNDFEDVPYGEWRLELEPSDTALQHSFLTVLQPCRQEAAAPCPAKRIASLALTGAHLADPSENVIVLFSSAPDGSPPSGVQSFSLVLTTPWARLLVFDLQPASGYTVSVEVLPLSENQAPAAHLRLPAERPTTAAAFPVAITLTPGGSSTVSSEGILDLHLDRRPQPGDLNLDGLVNAADYALLAGFLAGSFAHETIPGFVNADLNADGRVDTVDLVILLTQVLD